MITLISKLSILGCPRFAILETLVKSKECKLELVLHTTFLQKSLPVTTTNLVTYGLLDASYIFFYVDTHRFTEMTIKKFWEQCNWENSKWMVKSGKMFQKKLKTWSKSLLRSQRKDWQLKKLLITNGSRRSNKIKSHNSWKKRTWKPSSSTLRLQRSNKLPWPALLFKHHHKILKIWDKLS